LTRPYVLGKSAAADIREITRYTTANWGEERCRLYIAAIEAKATALACGQGHFKEMNTLLPGLRVAACGKHYIFCLPRQNAPALILAILHERMDMLAHLRLRLTEQ